MNHMCPKAEQEWKGVAPARYRFTFMSRSLVDVENHRTRGIIENFLKIFIPARERCARCADILLLLVETPIRKYLEG